MNNAAIFLGVFASVAPAGALTIVSVYVAANRESPSPRLTPARIAIVSCLVASLALFAMVAISSPFLDLLDVTPENFQLAAAAVMAVPAVRLLWTGSSLSLPEFPRTSLIEPCLVPIGVPALAGPAALVAVISYAASFGEIDVAIATLMALVASALLLAVVEPIQRTLGQVGMETLGRLSGALLFVAAAELALDGVHSV